MDVVQAPQALPPTPPQPEYAVIAIEKLQPNPWNRRMFSPEGLKSLCASITAKGVQEPLIVRRGEEIFEIASGHRRCNAAKMAGLKELPCLIRVLTDDEVKDMNILANMDREDTPPLELARMVKERMESGNLTQEQVAGLYGKDRTWVTNLFGFLKLPQDVLENVSALTLGYFQLQALKGIKNKEIQLQVSKELKEGTLKPQAIGKRAKELGGEGNQKHDANPEKASSDASNPTDKSTTNESGKEPKKKIPEEEPYQDYKMNTTWVKINRPFDFYEWTLEEWLESLSEDLYQFMEEHPCPICEQPILPDDEHPIHYHCNRLQKFRSDQRLMELAKEMRLDEPELDAKLQNAKDGVAELEYLLASEKKKHYGLWNNREVIANAKKKIEEEKNKAIKPINDDSHGDNGGIETN